LWSYHFATPRGETAQQKDTMDAPVSSTPAPSERPTFAQAFASEPSATDSQTVPASTETTPAASASADTTVPPASTTTGEITPAPLETKPQGEPPADRWPDILDNTRAKTRAEVEAEWQPYAWAKQVPQDSLQHMSNIAQRMTADPIGFLESYEAELVNHPTYGPQLRSRAGRTLAAGRTAAPSLDPDVQIVDPHGNVTGATYSADRVKAIVEQAIAQRLQPIEQDRQQQIATQKAQQEHARVESAADALLERAKGWEGFGDKANQILIATAWEAHPDWTLQDAYLHVFHTAILPTLSAKSQAKTLDDLKTKAAASTVNPASAVVASTKRPKSLMDKSLVW
jgi:hypothetical protein